jgi:hypothetical protein
MRGTLWVCVDAIHQILKAPAPLDGAPLSVLDENQHQPGAARKRSRRSVDRRVSFAPNDEVCACFRTARVFAMLKPSCSFVCSPRKALMPPTTWPQSGRARRRLLAHQAMLHRFMSMMSCSLLRGARGAPCVNRCSQRPLLQARACCSLLHAPCRLPVRRVLLQRETTPLIQQMSVRVSMRCPSNCPAFVSLCSVNQLQV